MMPEKIDKKSLLYLMVFIITILVCLGFFYYLSLMSKIEMEEKISEDREYIYQNKVTSECSSETCWLNDEGKKECTATFGKCQWINDEGTWKDFIDVVNMTFDYNSGDIIYFYKEDYSVTARLFLVVDVSQSVCEAQGWNWGSQDNACFLWWDKAKEFIEANGIGYDTIITKNPDRYKYALSLTKIPQNYQDKLLYVGLRLEEAKGLKWEDLKKQERSLTIKNKISLGFDDLIENGFTYKLYDERTILIGNVSNKENLWLDPIAEPATETSDGYIYGEDADYGIARSDSFSFDDGVTYMYVGIDYESGGGCGGTATACDSYDATEETYDGTQPAQCNNVDGCSWDGCEGTPPSCDSYATQGGCETYPFCVWDGCIGTATPCGDLSESFCGTSIFDPQYGCTWDGCGDGTPVFPCGAFLEAGCERFYTGCIWNGSECVGEPGECDLQGGDDIQIMCDFFCGADAWHGCSGTATNCDDILAESGCGNQNGCSWLGCGGAIGYSCDDYDYDNPFFCQRMSCIVVGCEGTADSCDSFGDESDCEDQFGCSWDDEEFRVYRDYLSFDTSSIPGDAIITDVKLSLKTRWNGSDTDFDVQIYKYNWAEPITSANREANYDAVGAVRDADWRNTSGMSTGVYYDSSSLDNSWVKLTGDTKYQLRSNRDVSTTEPTQDEYIGFYSANSAGNEPILNITYTANTAPTWDSIEVTPDPVNGGSTITVTAYGEDDLEHDTLAIYCDESTNPSSDSGHYDVCSGTGFTSPYNISCTGTAPTEGTSHTVYCKLYDGTEYSTQKQDTYTVNQSPDKPTDLNESWGCCGGIPQVALRTCLILNWSYSDPEGNPQAGYEVWVDDSLAGLAISPDLDPKFNHLVDPGPCPGPDCSYTVNLAADEEGDWLSNLAWFSIRPSSYHWKVKVRDSNGGWSDFSDPKSFTLPNRASPKVDFTPNPVNPRTDEEVTFIDDSKCYLSDDSEYDCDKEFETTGENDISYEWDFDYTGIMDDVDTTEGDTTYTYPEAGNYIVQLQITDIGVGGPFTGMCWKEVIIGFPLPTWKEITPF